MKPVNSLAAIFGRYYGGAIFDGQKHSPEKSDVQTPVTLRPMVGIRTPVIPKNRSNRVSRKSIRFLHDWELRPHMDKLRLIS